MKIATYNVRVDTDYDKDWSWDYRKEKIMALIQYHDWDLFGVQEVRPNQIKDMGSLNKYGCIAAERDGDGKGEGLALFYNQRLFNLIKSNSFWLSETPGKYSKHTKAAYPRICLWGIFEEIKSGKRVLIINVHLDHISEEARAEGINIIISELNKELYLYPSIILGDFNAERDEEVHKILRKVWKSAAHDFKIVAYGPRGTFQNFEYSRAWSDLEEIDYVYVREVEVLKVGIMTDSCDNRYPSDHFPVEVTIKI